MHRMVASRLTKVWALWKVWNDLPPGTIRTANTGGENRGKKGERRLHRDWTNRNCIVFISRSTPHRRYRNPMENAQFLLCCLFTTLCESIKQHAMLQFVRAEDSQQNTEKRKISQTKNNICSEMENGYMRMHVWRRNSETACTTSTESTQQTHIARRGSGREKENGTRGKSADNRSNYYIFCVRLYRAAKCEANHSHQTKRQTLQFYAIFYAWTASCQKEEQKKQCVHMTGETCKCVGIGASWTANKPHEKKNNSEKKS